MFDVLPTTHIDEYLGPYLAFIGGPLAAGWAMRQVTGHLAWILPASAVIIGGWMAREARAEAQPRGVFVQRRIAASVMWVFTASAVTAFVGFGGLWLPVLLFGGSCLGVWWNIRRTDAIRGDGRDETPAQSGVDELLGLPGARAKLVSRDDTREVWRVRARDGQGGEDVQKALKRIVNWRSMPAVGSRATVDLDHSDTATVVLMRQDTLKEALPWPGPSSPGGSIADPIVAGRYEDGDPERYWLVGDPAAGRSAPAVGVKVGVPGSGKTEGGLVEAGEILSRRDAVLWWCDTIKGPQSVAPILDGIDWLATTHSDAKAMLAAIDRAARFRARHLGAWCPTCRKADIPPEPEHTDEATGAEAFTPVPAGRCADCGGLLGLKEWQPGCGLPFLVARLEEAARILPDSRRFVRLSEAVRSVGIFIDTSLQRASADNYPTDARSNIGLVVCFGTGDQDSAPMVLSDNTLNGGVDPALWKSTRPGYHVLEAPGVPVDRWPVPARYFLPTSQQLEDVVHEFMTARARLDSGTASAAGEARRAWRVAAGRDQPRPHQLTTEEAAEPPKQEEHPMPKPRDPDDDAHDAHPDLSDGEITDRLDDPTEQPDLELDRVDLDDELADDMAAIDPREPVDVSDPPAVDLSDAFTGRPELTEAERHVKFAELLERVLAAVVPAGGPARVSMGELADAWYEIPGITPVQRPALDRRMRRLGRAGLQGRVARGLYEIHPAAPGAARAWAGAPGPVTFSDDEDDDEGPD